MCVPKLTKLFNFNFQFEGKIDKQETEIDRGNFSW